MADLAPLDPISREHLRELDGALGIMQHAIGSIPDPAHGYCVDDVARALEVDLLHGRVLGWPAVADTAWRSLQFLQAAFDDDSGRFRNFRSVSGAWLRGVASEDSQGRAMLALGMTIAGSPDRAMARVAAALWGRALPAAARITALRAQASVALGCVAMLEGGLARRLGHDVAAASALADLATGLHARFRGQAFSDWPWPEPVLTYENAVLPRALIVAGRSLGSPSMVAAGLAALDWLMSVQTASAGHFSPIGNEWWPRGGVRSRYDQQPIEATATLLAAEAALRATGESRYQDAMESAYGWFLGDNDLGASVADPARGAGCDGLTPAGRNTNEGAESTLMWLMAAEHIRILRADTPRSVHAEGMRGLVPQLAGVAR